MARHQNVNWSLSELNADRTVSIHVITAAVLMDIRDELKLINATLQCRNFQKLPAAVRRIANNTAKPTRKRPSPLGNGR